MNPEPRCLQNQEVQENLMQIGFREIQNLERSRTKWFPFEVLHRHTVLKLHTTNEWSWIYTMGFMHSVWSIFLSWNEGQAYMIRNFRRPCRRHIYMRCNPGSNLFYTYCLQGYTKYYNSTDHTIWWVHHGNEPIPYISSSILWYYIIIA